MAAGTRPIATYWHAGRADNFTTATDLGRASAESAGYKHVREDGLVFAAHVSDSDPLMLFWSEARQDNFTAPPAGVDAAKSAGYTEVRTEGFVLRGMPSSPYTRFRSWWNSQRGDNFLTASLLGDRDAERAGYQRVRVADGFGPALRNIAVTRHSKPNVQTQFQNGVAYWFDGTGFTPNGMVYSAALTLDPGNPWPEHSLGSVRADAQGRIRDLSLRTTSENLPARINWVGIITDAVSCSEIAIGPVR